jgi:hypothetical protein
MGVSKIESVNSSKIDRKMISFLKRFFPWDRRLVLADGQALPKPEKTGFISSMVT